VKTKKKTSKSSTIDAFSLADRIRYLRRLRDMTQSDLAKASGVSQSTVAQIEMDKIDPSIKTLRQLCAALEVDPAVVFARDHVHVFVMDKLDKKYKSVADLNPTLYHATGEVLRWAKKIGF
jgi:transcriptional regulator with XRE-family HTH domain